MTAGNVRTPHRPTIERPLASSPVPLDVLATAEGTVAAYVGHLSRTGLAVSTQTKYGSHLRRFAAWLDGHPDHAPAQVFTDPWSRDHVMRDWRSAALDAKLAAATIDLSFAALDGLWEWVGLGRTTVKRVGGDVASLTRFGEHLDSRQDRAVLRAAERRGVRDLAIIALLRFAGLRVEEVHLLDATDVWVTAGKGAVEVRGKGSRIRQVPLNAAARKALRPWLAERRDYPTATSEPALFLTRAGTRVAVRSLRYMVREVGAAAGIPTLHPHQLRHTMARGLIDAGVALPEVQGYLGHKSISTTMIYTRPSVSQHDSAIEAGAVEW